jgi:hypothetical protein
METNNSIGSGTINEPIANSKFCIAARIKVTRSKSGRSWTAIIQDNHNNFYSRIRSTHSIDDILRKWVYQCFNDELQALKDITPLPRYLSIDYRSNMIGKLHITGFDWCDLFQKMGYVFIAGWYDENFILLMDERKTKI